MVYFFLSLFEIQPERENTAKLNSDVFGFNGTDRSQCSIVGIAKISSRIPWPMCVWRDAAAQVAIYSEHECFRLES